MPQAKKLPVLAVFAFPWKVAKQAIDVFFQKAFAPRSYKPSAATLCALHEFTSELNKRAAVSMRHNGPYSTRAVMTKAEQNALCTVGYCDT